MNWGEAEPRLGKFAEAEAILQRAWGLKSDYPRARFSLGYTAADFANPGGRGGEESEGLIPKSSYKDYFLSF